MDRQATLTRIDWEAVRAAHLLADVALRTGIALRGGADVMVRCPMPVHDERTASMALHLRTNRYHCFGCGSSGDVIQWVRDLEGLDVVDAIAALNSGRTLVARRGYTPGPIPQAPVASQTAEQPDPARTGLPRVHEAVQLAWAFYTLPTAHDAGVAYLAGRHLDVSALEHRLCRPVVGHAFAGPDDLLCWLQGKGFSVDELVDAGLVVRRPGRPVIDLFRRRAMLPVHDTAGEVCGLLGRSTHAAVGAPKYLNQPRTGTYDKATDLYRPSVECFASTGSVIVCEGALDALAIAVAALDGGRSEWVAPVSPSGVALSEEHLTEILGLSTKHPVLAADGDRSGRAAMLRWSEACAERGRDSWIVDWPSEHDPASWLAEHGHTGLAAFTPHIAYPTGWPHLVLASKSLVADESARESA